MSHWNWYEHAAHHGRGPDFAQVGLQYAILAMLEQHPSRGYELVRALEERFHGFLGTGAAVVYPTLEWLEDVGYVTAAQGEGGKVYSITDEGRRHLAMHGEQHDEGWGRMGCAWGRGAWGGFDSDAFRAEMHDFWREMREIGKDLHHRGWRVSSEKMQRIHDVALRAGKEIHSILNETEPAAAAPEASDAATNI